MSEIEQQEKLVLWSYGIQWFSLLMPPAIIASLVFLVVFRKQVTNPDIRSHVRWQLATCIITFALIPLGVILLAIGLSGIATDAPASIIATFTLLAFSAGFPIWFLYRLIYGSYRFSQQQPMNRIYL
jgi:uncharacterized membrane protein